MKNVLLLVHRIPYPPNKGDKIRSFHILQYLAQRANIFLGCFVDDPEDLVHVDKLTQYCKQHHVTELNRSISLIRSLSSFFTGKAMTFPYFYKSSMAKWVDGVIRDENIDCIFVFSSSMAQYVQSSDAAARVIDFVDVDSQKWIDYGVKKRFPLNFLYKREGTKLRKAERLFADAFDVSFFVSDQEVDCFRSNVCVADDTRVMALYNGVDTDYFDPGLMFDSPYSRDEKNLVFTGAMDYWANADAMVWFVKSVLPRIQTSSVRLTIVGANPTRDVQDLDAFENVTVTGRVNDVRPFILHADVAVAPLRIARGIQNKVLEALAMQRPVVMTTGAAEGIAWRELQESVVVDDPENMALAIDELMGKMPVGAPEGREYVMQRHDWDSCLAKLESAMSLSDGGIANAVAET